MKIAYSLALLCLLIQSHPKAQTRIYVSAGVVRSEFSGQRPSPLVGARMEEVTFKNSDIGGALYFDALIEKRFIGSFYFVTGLSFFESNYDREVESYGSYVDPDMRSAFNSKNIGVPVLVRYNLMNTYSAFVDVGVQHQVSLFARLAESYGQTRVDRDLGGDFPAYTVSFALNAGLFFNRFTMNFFARLPLRAISVNDFGDGYALKRDESAFLENLLTHKTQNFSVSAGYRIR